MGSVGTLGERCRNGHAVDAGDVFCRDCGTRARCPVGHPAGPSDRFCGTCGVALDGPSDRRRPGWWPVWWLVAALVVVAAVVALAVVVISPGERDARVIPLGDRDNLRAVKQAVVSICADQLDVEITASDARPILDTDGTYHLALYARGGAGIATATADTFSGIVECTPR